MDNIYLLKFVMDKQLVLLAAASSPIVSDQRHFTFIVSYRREMYRRNLVGGFATSLTNVSVTIIVSSMYSL